MVATPTVTVEQATTTEGPGAATEPLTVRQGEVLRFMAVYFGQYGCMPTIREVGHHFGISSPNGVACHLKALVKKGHLVEAHETGTHSRGLLIPELLRAAQQASEEYLMTRDEYLTWCKQRALEYLPHDPAGAVASMLSDLNKRDETRKVVEGPIGMMGIMAAAGGNAGEVRSFIEGFH